ncbi:MAG: hypothetical protein A2571_00110 [Candidatus Vogelbacteria bacterium RIFOXYD1_FULL_44_32]|uniref:MurNAc-LAA domain-containing protein n=1 Tax=Candidatus Vogelbacteria bacterium RIFOXYD1_FULL_44_32 TaxID=1802438 RepID=A0A1G2QE94_9BACT|nr:MAG: hypothetical protein A2571_00110 [Candidatus Vogelbacteria bacterium RIFOXYD1_FULL_44_32]
MKKYISLVIVLLVVLILVIFFFPAHITAKILNQTASVFFIDSVTTKNLRQKYEDEKPIKILVVPGHDPSSYGTIDQGVRELDLNLELGRYLAERLERDERFEVTLAQTKDGFLPALAEYFEQEKNLIWQFRQKKAEIMNALVGEGKVTRESVVDHISASNDTALKLYGINHWANENKIDLVIHIHFNDYPGRRQDVVPKYTGYAIYLPEHQYSNSKASWDIGQDIADRLSTKFPSSNHPKETAVLIPDQELIAIGAFNTLDATSVLVEYGYIYEPSYAPATPADRSQNLKQLARLTASGVEDFFKD